MPRRDKFSVVGCRTARAVEKAVRKQGGIILGGGRHDKAYTKDGRGPVPIPRHTGDLARGTAGSIVKALLVLGFFALIAGCLFIAGTSLYCALC